MSMKITIQRLQYWTGAHTAAPNSVFVYVCICLHSSPETYALIELIAQL